MYISHSKQCIPHLSLKVALLPSYIPVSSGKQHTFKLLTQCSFPLLCFLTCSPFFTSGNRRCINGFSNFANFLVKEESFAIFIIQAWRLRGKGNSCLTGVKFRLCKWISSRDLLYSYRLCLRALSCFGCVQLFVTP